MTFDLQKFLEEAGNPRTFYGLVPYPRRKGQYLERYAENDTLLFAKTYSVLFFDTPLLVCNLHWKEGKKERRDGLGGKVDSITASFRRLGAPEGSISGAILDVWVRATPDELQLYGHRHSSISDDPYEVPKPEFIVYCGEFGFDGLQPITDEQKRASLDNIAYPKIAASTRGAILKDFLHHVQDVPARGFDFTFGARNKSASARGAQAYSRRGNLYRALRDHLQ